MYTVTMAARMSTGSFEMEFSKAAAVPWKLATMLAGIPSEAVALRILSTAAPSEACGARLNDRVTAGNCPW